jgi:hypothetical protein
MNNRSNEVPVYLCKKIDKEIKISGRITDPEWKKAQKIKLVDNNTGGPAEQITEVRLLYSSSSLYISFYCEDDFIWGTYDERDSPIYNEECVEVFINPASCEHQYYEVNVSPKNTVFDACILTNRITQRENEGFTGLTEFNPDIKTKVHIEGAFGTPGKGRFWSVELAIPFKELFGAPNPIPLPGDKWRMNLFRIDSPKQGNVRYYSWSPTGKINFHLPWKFGILQFN